MSKIVNEYEPSSNEIFYHYCSADTFYNIIESKSLWFCDIRHMNDREELSYGYKLFENSLKNSNIPEDLQKMVIDTYKQFYDSLVLLSFSFSESGEILSQWRGYADNAKGFCVGFNAKEAVSILPFCSLKVIYNEEEQKSLMSNSIKTIISNLKSDNLTILNLISELIEVFAQIKHPSFCEEKELRLTHALIKNEDGTLTDEVNEQNPTKYGLHKIKFRLVNNIPTPYVSVDFPNNDNFVKEVIIGPKNQSEISDIQLFLANNDINNIEVRKDMSPFV